MSVSSGLTCAIALYLIGTSRWGSYVGPPGVPVFVTDLVLALASVALVIGVARREMHYTKLTDAPLVLQLTMTLVGYAALRLAMGPFTTLDALRDAAPYLYGIAAVFAYLRPVSVGRRWRLAIYGVLFAHLLWAVLLPRVHGYPWSLPTLGSDATVLATRPDFDSCVLGITAAMALRAALATRRANSTLRRCGAVAVLIASWYGVLAQSTRAGLLSALVTGGAVVLAHLLAQRTEASAVRSTKTRTSTKWMAAAALLVLLVVGIALSPTGSRLEESFRGDGGQAAGTVSVRQTVWRSVSEYVVRSPERTSIGIGFGRNFIAESGMRAALEGSTYTNVRSPHNYVIGTLARLGVAGALLVVIVIGLSTTLAWRTLLGDPDTATLLAALTVLGIPVVALLGVVLEAPFGAVPYFWAMGHLAARRYGRETGVESLPR